MDLGLKDKRIIVTGAANGIGTAIYLALVQEGSVPIGIDIEELSGSELEARLLGDRPFHLDEQTGRISSSKQGPNALKELYYFQGDAGDWDSMSEVVQRVQPVFGLVNNAGFLGGDDSHFGTHPNTFRKLMHSHGATTYTMTHLVAPGMVREGVGSIVNIGTIDLDMASYAGVSAYAMGHGAKWGATVADCVRYAPEVRVNMVCPGNVNTERNKAQYEQVRALIDGFEARTPLQQSAEPEEVADAVLFLLSTRAGFITGTRLDVDGGFIRQLWDPAWAPREVYGPKDTKG